MTGLTVEAVGQRLAASLCRDDACAVLCTRLVRLLAEGRPVSPDRLAAALGSSRAAVDATLREIPNVECDDVGGSKSGRRRVTAMNAAHMSTGTASAATPALNSSPADRACGTARGGRHGHNAFDMWFSS